MPPRPSGIKRPDRDLHASDRVAFGALSTFLTGMRGLGYYREYLTGSTADPAETVPELATDD